jgi:hypothetical protein
MSNRLANIGAIEQRKRLALGLCLVFASVVLLVVMLQQGLETWWRLWLFVPLWAGVLGLMQARTKT